MLTGDSSLFQIAPTGSCHAEECVRAEKPRLHIRQCMHLIGDEGEEKPILDNLYCYGLDVNTVDTIFYQVEFAAISGYHAANFSNDNADFFAPSV